MEAKIAFEDGRIFNGFSFGATGESQGEVVFNTSMTGYQEILTDPSYKGQIVTMTYPLIGNYGVNKEDVESKKIFAQGLIVREYSQISSNWRSTQDLAEYLKDNNVIGIQGVDTRAITRHIRKAGAMRAVISTIDMDDQNLINKAKKIPSLLGQDLVREVTDKNGFEWNKSGEYKVVVIDCGVKFSILRALSERGCHVVCVSAFSSAEEIMAYKPDGVLLSNGPGDPEGAKYVAECARKLLGKIPVFGICLGHQMLSLALGGKTYKLKFGHHGGNHPVKDMKTGHISITSQNHCFCVDLESLKEKNINVTHINLNDNTVEGMESDELKFFSIQFHPEAGPGPNDAVYMFDRFIENMKDFKK
ncbi:MAG: glutamine-hydrolyzing carbamoyl-phosphate synthase small subunit [Candidatus Omnitrophota bacterium]